MTFGLIKWFDTEKEFGIIVSTKNSEEVFLHISNWEDKKNISSANKIFLEFEIGFQRNKITATKCKYFSHNNTDNWETLFNLSKEEVNLKVEYKTYNLIELAFNSIPENFDFQIIEPFVYEKIRAIDEENIFEENILYTIINNTQNQQVRNYLLIHLKNRISNLDSDIQFDFWIKKIITDFIPPKDIVLKYFNKINIDLLNSIQDVETRNLIIIKQVIQLDTAFEYERFNDFEKLLKIIEPENFKNKILKDLEQIVEKHYKKTYLNLLKETLILSDDIYEIKKKLKSLPNFIIPYIEKTWKKEIRHTIIKYANIDTVIELWQEELIEDIDDVVVNNLKEITSDNYLFINSDRISNETKLKIIEFNFEKANYIFILNACNNSFPELFDEYDYKIFQTAEPSEHFKLWESNKSKIVPISFLSVYLDESKQKYSEIDKWLSRKQISVDQINEILLKKINNCIKTKNRKDFYIIYYSLQKYLELNENNFNKIETINNDFIQLLLWHFGLIDDFDLEILKRKFIYFSPKEQVYIFKRLFYLKHNNKIDFTIEELDEILRADLDLYLLNIEFDNDFILDISTHILIEAIKSYIKKGSFLFESDLILKDLQRNSTRKFQIENYFDKCEGRMTADWNWHTEGKIKQITFPNDPSKFYYAIEFPAAFERTGNNYYGSYTYYEKNPNFEYLKNEVKKLSGRKWNDKLKHWGVSSKYEQDVLEFAKKNRFFIELKDKKHYDNNIHLVAFSRNDENGEQNIPSGIKFCEGRKAKIPHKKFKREFWWCANQECFENATIDHIDDNLSVEKDSNLKIWEYYTFLDILKIMHIDVDETNHMGDFIPNGHYYKFIGHINAFNRLLDKLYCEECGELLYPTQTSHFALYRDTRFHCENINCKKYKETIYLNHCLNGECTNIIDSRLSKKCDNGLYICNSCGTCCSTDMFKRRLENLKLTGGYIHPELIDNVELEKGHLEKAEYYCYKCKGMMTEITNTLYKCFNCGTKYDLEKYKWIDRRWTKKYARRKDYPQVNSSIENDDDIVF